MKMVSRLSERLIPVYCFICAALLVGCVFCIIGFLWVKGMGALSLSLLFGDTPPIDALLLRKQVFNGLFPAIAGTVSLVILSVTIAIPIGTGAGIYMAEYCPGRLKPLFSLFFDILAGIPSIVVGLFGFSVTIFLHTRFSERIYPCLFISGVSLAFLVLPYLIRTTQLSLESLPAETRRTAVALGATRLQNLFYVLLPRSLPGIVSGIILSIGRCAEDTAVIMLTGVVATAGIPHSLFSTYEALPFYIYYISSQYANRQELQTGYGAAIILITVCAVLFSFSIYVQKRLAYHSLYRL